MSQCLEDSTGWRRSDVRQDSSIKELYNERHRLALETLVSEGIDSFTGFLNKERIPNFLSDDEIRRISHAAIVPRYISLVGDDSHLDQSSTLDCSSLTYFPEISDLEPPVLEMGWPAFTTGSFRGVTRAVAYFQPSYGENIYSCKEAARRMIKTAKEVKLKFKFYNQSFLTFNTDKLYSHIYRAVLGYRHTVHILFCSSSTIGKVVAHLTDR